MNRPCPNVVTCPGSDDPVTNYSSEQTDTLDFVSMFWRGAAFPGALPLGVPWSLNACGAIITGTDTQIETELEAIIAAINCDFQNKYGNGPGAIPGTPNDAQICCQAVPGTVTRCFTIQSGKLVALNKASANQIASALACYQVSRSAMTLRDLDSSDAQVGKDYLDAIDALGGFGMVTFNIIGTTPPGLVFQDVGGGVLTVDGIPTQDGVFSFVVTAQDSLGTRVQKTYTITVKPADCTGFFSNPSNWSTSTTASPLPGAVASAFQSGISFNLAANSGSDGLHFGQSLASVGWEIPSFTGPGITCKLTVQVSASAGFAIATVLLTALNNQAPFDLITIIPQQNLPNGTSILTFTIPALSDYDLGFEVSVDAQTDIPPNPGPATSVSVSGTFGPA